LDCIEEGHAMKMKRFAGLGALAGIAMAAACGGARDGRPVASAPSNAARVEAAASHGACGRLRAATSTAVPLGAVRVGSTVALATQGGRTLAFAADEDDGAVHVVDVEARKELGETVLDSRPSQLMFLQDGRLAVLLRDKSQIEILEPADVAGRLEKRCTVDTAAEPVALAASPDDAVIFVTSGWGRALGAFDAGSLKKSFEVALPREPRAVVVSDDGKFAYVSHAVGALASRVTLADKTVRAISLRERDPGVNAQARELEKSIARYRKTGQPIPADVTDQLEQLDKTARPSCQGFALAKSSQPGGRILAPQVLVDTGDPNQRAPGYGNDQSATEAGDVAVIDATTGTPIAASLERSNDNVGWGNIDPRDARPGECLLPRAAVVDPASSTLLVSCLGVDQIIAYDALAASPAKAERARWSVGAGPNGIAIDPAKHRAIAWSQFDRVLDIIDLGDGQLADDKGRPPQPVDRVEMAASTHRAIPVATALGRLLFHAVGDARISRDGRACASCHPDGRDDSLVWATPDGPRRSIMLAGRVQGTEPYAWNGSESDLRVHLSSTFDRLNGAGGLKSVELAALTAYVESLAPPPALPASYASQLHRGAELFASSEVGCGTCHSGALGTDHQRHDVKSKTDADRTGEFNTPSLHLIGGTGPYFHDGRYKTLHDLLSANKDQMGHTSQLAPADLDALEAYVRTL
jgi:DNA-binding beta-propeller fold protein YncE